MLRPNISPLLWCIHLRSKMRSATTRYILHYVVPFLCGVGCARICRQHNTCRNRFFSRGMSNLPPSEQVPRQVKPGASWNDSQNDSKNDDGWTSRETARQACEAAMLGPRGIKLLTSQGLATIWNLLRRHLGRGKIVDAPDAGGSSPCRFRGLLLAVLQQFGGKISPVL